MKTSGNARVQKTAARSRDVAPDVRDGQGEEGLHRSASLVSRAAPDRSGRGRRPRASPGGRARFWASTPCASVEVEQRPDRRRRRRACRRAGRVVVVLDATRRRAAPRARHRSTPSMASNRTARSLKRLRDELVDGAHLEDVAVVHDREPIAQDLGLLHVVRRQQDRPALRLEVEDEVPEGAPGGRVEAGRRLVEEDQLRVVDQRQGDRRAAGAARPTAPASGRCGARRARAGRSARPSGAASGRSSRKRSMSSVTVSFG